MFDSIKPPRPPHPKAVETAMDVSDELCGGIYGPKAPACRALVMKKALHSDEPRAELERMVEEKFR